MPKALRNKESFYKMHFLKITALTFLSCLVVTSCSSLNPFSSDDEKAPLPGERISVMDFQKDLEPDDVAIEAEGFIAPEQWRNEYWPQAGGYPNHAMQNLALSSGALTKIWSADIGQGSKDALPLTAQPIVFDGRVFTMNTNSEIYALDMKSGKRLWKRVLRPKGEDEAVITGGIAYSSGKLYATSGYNDVFAINPENGEVLWRVGLTSPSRAAPTILKERVYVVTVDNKILALNETDGSVLWEYQGLSEQAGLVGMASPAADNEIVVPVFSSGELYALRVENGSVAWSESLSPIRRLGGVQSIADIRALPILDKGRVYAISFNGRMVALEERTGNRIWQREIGSANTPWIAGNHIFVINNNNEVAALSSDSGAVIWVKKLPRYLDEAEQEDPIVLKGPVLAGGRLIIAGTNGLVYEINPVTGEVVRQWSLKKTIVTAPIVASGVAFFLTEDGRLHAYQ